MASPEKLSKIILENRENIKLKKGKKGKTRKSTESNENINEKTVKKRKSSESIEAVLTDVSSVKSKKSKKKKSEEPGKFEKGDIKPLNVINTAAKKLRKIKDEDPVQDEDKKGVKIKREQADGKQKMEEMKFKDRKKVRRESKANADTTGQCKAIWEQLRRHSISTARKEELTNKLYHLVKGHAKELIFAHDTSRVVQCLIKSATEAQRNGIFEELKGEILTMSKTKYAKFLVRKMLEFGKKEQKQWVFTALYGNVRKLIKHQEAAEIIELAYNDFADARQRSALVEEFYGPSFALFKTKDARTLSNILDAHPEKRDSILENMKEILNVIIDKDICKYSIVHRVFLDYFTHVTGKERTEMIEVVRESLVHMIHTRDGARVAMQCIWNGTSKDRKVIVKSLKTFVVKICQEEYGHLVLLSIFDSVDDTKLVQKVILEEMLKSLSTVAGDQHGRKVLYYLLTPRDTKHFHPDIQRILAGGDNNPISKKESTVRRAELAVSIYAPLLKFAAENVQELVVLNSTMLLYISILNNCQGQVEPAMKALAEQAVKPVDDTAGDQVHIVEHAFGHVALKRLIKHDKERTPTPLMFTHILLKTVPVESLVTWTQCNRGCFILLSMLELEDAEITKKLNAMLNPFKTNLKSKAKSSKGAQILLSKLQ